MDSRDGFLGVGWISYGIRICERLDVQMIFDQISIFDIGKTLLKIDKPIRLIELFAGIGSQAKALERLGVDFEHYRVCEFDKYAIKSYNAIHGTDFETSDITQIKASDLGIVDTDKYEYIMTYSFPCQDLSLAGLQKGMAKGGNTRSGLLWEVERLLNECDELPQILLMENVTQVHGTKTLEHFRDWIEYLESKGYSNYWEDLNAKNYGIPQNRNRTFMVSVLGDYTYEFPKPFPLELRLKDMLEYSVDEKYYLSEKLLIFFVRHTEKQKAKSNGFAFKPTNGDVVAKAITTKAGTRTDDNYIREDSATVGTLTTNCGADLKRNGFGIIEPLAYDEQNGYIREDGTVGSLTTDGSSPKHNNRVIENYYVSEKGVKFICDPKRGMCTDVNADVSQPLTAKGQANWTGSFVSPDIESLEKSSSIGSKEPTKINLKDGTQITSNDDLSRLRIRKLTPRECFRLMGFDDADFDKAAEVNSNAQLYKQAGNSIVVDVLVKIFKNMF